MLLRLKELLFPSKCVLCRKLLTDHETDLCRDCRMHAPEFVRAKRNIPFVANWTAIWYYRGDVRRSMRRFKFGNVRSYAINYGRLLAMRILRDFPEGFDFLTWIPVSPLRKLTRGYDQSQLLAEAVAAQLGTKAIKLLRKRRHNAAQSGIREVSIRRANVLNAYRLTNAQSVLDKRILLIDDVVTTGATASECARTLLTAGAVQVQLACVASAVHDKK